jgi:hypothetical protein
MGKNEVFTNIISAFTKVIDIWNIVLFVLSLGGGGGTVVAALNHIPIYYPVIGGVITLGLIIFGIVRTLVRYNRWKAVSNDPTLLKILKTLQKLHNQLGELSVPISKRRIGKNTLIKISTRFGKLLNIDADKYQELQQQPMNDETWDFLFNRIVGTYKLNLKEFTSLTDMLVDIGKTMDKEGCGLSVARNDEKYQEVYKELKDLQLELNLADRNNALWIDKAYEYSFGLHSMRVSFGFMEKHKEFIDKMPASYISFADRTLGRFDAAYTNVLLKVKQIIMDDLWKGAK